MYRAGPVGELPADLTRFIGRDRELAALRELAVASRLLTLTGAGGSGKSRLARELVPDLAASAACPVVWIELAPVTDPALVPGVVLRVLDPSAEKGANATQLLIDLLRDRPATLVLDNCEHLVDACALLADALLRACPALRIVATSREALSVPGERAWLVPPLSLPDTARAGIERADCDAVRLFVERARDVAPDFEVSERNADVVADICLRLDGIPLAIELAAARVRLLPLEQIRDRLSDAFALLTSGARTALPRHRTLRAAIDWSHDLLSEPARTVLRRLSVFRAGFTLDAAEAVAAGGGIAVDDVLELVATLLDRSLLVMREQDGSARYHLLETMRQYARQRLRAAGEEEQAQRAMAAFFAAAVAAAEPSFTTTERRAAFARLDPDLDNIREVLHWTYAHDGATHVRLVGMMWWYWFSSRYWMEARQVIDGALALPAGTEPARPRAALLFAGGALAALQAQVPAARAQLAEAIELARAAGDERLEAYALNYMGMTYAQVSDPAAREYSGRAAQWLRRHDDAYGLRLALLLMGMGEAAAGDLVRARTLMEEAVTIARRFGQDRELGVALQTLAFVVIATGDLDEAERLLTEALAALRRDWSYLFVGRAVDMLALTALPRDPAEAARRIGAGDALREHVGAARFQLDQARIDAAVAKLRDALGDAEYDRQHAAGAARASEMVDEIALGAGAAATTLPVTEAVAVSRSPAAPRAIADAVDLRVRTLGPFEVWVAGEPVTQWSYAKPKELLAYLIAHPRGRSRVEIGSAMWPGATPAQLRNSFHVTLHHLRKSLGRADWVVIENDRYRLAPGVSVDSDAARFESEARRLLNDRPSTPTARADQRDRLRAALDLYQADYLMGEVAGAWRDEEQDRLRRLYVDVALRLGELLEHDGAGADAVVVYEAVIAREPLLEEAHRRLIAYWSRAGDRVRAIRHYERLAAQLEQELELEPDPETTALYRSLKQAGGQADPLPA
jgi:predicted ATPase/two-component SAPR family response regulator